MSNMELGAGEILQVCKDAVAVLDMDPCRWEFLAEGKSDEAFSSWKAGRC